MKKLLSLLLISFICESAMANEKSDFQMYVRTGTIYGNYDGVFDGEFNVDLAFDIGGEYFVAPNGSVIFRFIHALDNPDSVPFYTYTGSGFRYYFDGRGPRSEQQDRTLFFSSNPKLRLYAATELGVAQVIVKTFGPVVQSVASMVEWGLNTGGIYQISKNVGVEVQVGGTLGFGISSTSVNGSTARALVGMTYFF